MRGACCTGNPVAAAIVDRAQTVAPLTPAVGPLRRAWLCRWNLGLAAGLRSVRPRRDQELGERGAVCLNACGSRALRTWA
jgi:hypothetical protein